MLSLLAVPRALIPLIACVGPVVKIGAQMVRHCRYLVFQLAEAAVPRAMFAAVLRRIDRLRRPPVAVV